ncbi:MAG: recombination mediator RecR, partial [Actinomycetota bacterium]|nr:recombination mediator RecR [Actinomycetota bacterium]
MAFHLLGVEKADALRLSTAIADMREQLGICQRCFNVTAGEECSICRDLKREVTLLCVVERAQDIAVIERSQEFRGRYHVLGGAISPIGGVGPSQLHIAELGKRVIDEKIEELILATNPTVEGDVTAMYIAREMKPLGVRVTRLAMGLPVGGDLDYADELTLGRALTGRLEL